MASLAYDSFYDDVFHAAFDLDTATVKVMLVTSAYTENKGAHTKRSDVTNEVTGTGYTAGGTTCTATLAKDTTNHRITLTLGQVTWPSSTITARKAIYYISRGGASSADELIAVDDFGSDVSTTGVTLTLNATTITLQN
jgi:hypothetical protein